MWDSGRWAMIFDKDGKVIYAENEKNPGEVDVSIGLKILR
jgi:alkyl hydroperoxide reductase 1